LNQPTLEGEYVASALIGSTGKEGGGRMKADRINHSPVSTSPQLPQQLGRTGGKHPDQSPYIINYIKLSLLLVT